jgi:hypothetical protein
MSTEEELIARVRDLVTQWAENWSPMEAFDYMELIEAALNPETIDKE